MMELKIWMLILAYAGLVATGVESVQEKDVSSIVLVVLALVGLTAYVQLVERGKEVAMVNLLQMSEPKEVDVR